jgi:phosphatidylglycerophosphate synthase
MVAVEHGRKTPLGVLYNEFPDRVADSVILVALGYACEVPWLGWLSALGAALTAYVRVFGGALGFAQDDDHKMLYVFSLPDAMSPSAVRVDS